MKSSTSLERGAGQRVNTLLVSLLLAANLSYLGWRALFTLPFGMGALALALGILLFAVEALGALESFIHYTAINAVRQPALPEVPPDSFPDVDVFITTYSESASLLYKTVNGCLHMDYPDRKKVHIYICDDGARPEIRQLASDMGVGYLDRTSREGAKAGNLNNALAKTSSPLIVTFDADMIPQHNFLLKTTPYFMDNEGGLKKNIGFVQTPQSFYNPDLFQANLFAEDYLPNEQDYFYKVIEVSRNKSNSVIYGGSNTVISRAALEAIGGFYTKTITEDFATGILIEKKGFTCYGIGETLASGIAVDNLKGLINQRTRWARGCIATGRKLHILFSKNLTLSQKLNYWASVFYWFGPFKKFIFIASPILFSVFGVIMLKCGLAGVLAFWLPKFVLENIVMRRFSSNIRTLHWAAIYETLLFPFLLIPTGLEALGISLKKFNVTKKDSVTDEAGFAYAAPFLTLIALSLVGVFFLLRTIIVFNVLYPVVVLFWLLYNLGQLVIALFFVLGEGLYRRRDTVSAEIPAVLAMRAGQDGLACRTVEIDEDYILLEAESAGGREDVEWFVFLRLAGERYAAEIAVNFVKAVKRGGRTYYSFRITDFLAAKSEYFQMLYDRQPAMPAELGSFWENLSLFWWSLRNEIQAVMWAYKGRVFAAAAAAALVIAGLFAGNYFLYERKLPAAGEQRIGWNLGNSLDAWGVERKLLSTYMPVQYETYWGNPEVRKRLLRSVRKAGFDTIRIPVTWTAHFRDGKIEKAWMRRVKEVVDYALLCGFYVILDAHHEPVLSEGTDNSANEEAFREIWRGIAVNFADYNRHLIFESVNEPRLIGSAEEWTSGTKEAREEVNRLNRIFVETVRASGGENDRRLLLLPGYCTGSGTEVLEALWLPENDENVGAAVHLYSPRPFAIDYDGAGEWEAENGSDTAEVDAVFADIERIFTSRGRRVFFTEFGAGDKNNEAAREAWARYVLTRAGAQDIVSVWWDNGNTESGDLGFALFERGSGKTRFQTLVGTLTGAGHE